MHDSILNSKQVFQFDVYTQTQQIRVRLGTELAAVIDCIRHMTQKQTHKQNIFSSQMRARLLCIAFSIYRCSAIYK